MNLTQPIKNQLLLEFKSEKIIKKIIEEKQIFRLINYNIQTIQKIFEIQQTNLFKESNSKKHLNKIQELIKNQFFSKLTQNYLNIILYPTNQKKIIEDRRKALNLFKLNPQIINLKELKIIISKLQKINKKVVFNSNIITLEKQIEENLYNKFKIHSTTYSKNELEEYILKDIEPRTIIITNEDLYIDIPTYTTKEFEKIIKGNILNTNKKEIIKLLEILEIIKPENQNIIKSIFELTNVPFDFQINSEKLNEIFSTNNSSKYKELTTKTLNLDSKINEINDEIKNIISSKRLSLQGDELLDLLNSGDISSIQEKFKKDTKEIIIQKEKEIIALYKNEKINIDFIFSSHIYPLKLDEEIKEEILNKIDSKIIEEEFNLYSKLGEFDFKKIEKLWDFTYFLDLLLGIKQFENKYNLKNINLTEEIVFLGAKNIYLEHANPVNYAIGAKQINDIKLNSEKVTILTGANSGGKTTMLELNLQSQILTTLGLGCSMQKESKIKLFDEIIYLKKFTGTIGSGAFEQTIRNLIDILDSNSSKFILIDEFEAVTEPGAAARILIMFLKEIIKQDSFCIAASHLGQEILEYINEEKITSIRIDGISASGLDENSNLITTHQPEFYKLGQSTPELILQKILQDSKYWKKKNEKSKKILENIINKKI